MEAERTVLIVRSMSCVCELQLIAVCAGFVKFNPRPELNNRLPADVTLQRSDPSVKNLIIDLDWAHRLTS